MDREQVLFRLFGKFCPEGTILYTEGAPGEELYVIQSGAVRLGPARPDGARAEPLGPGELLGEEAFFARAPRTTRAEVVKDARLIQVNERTIDTVARHGPETARLILERFIALAGSARTELALWTVERLLPRLAPDLTVAAAAAAGIRPGDLAEAAGLAASDVEQVLDELERRGALVHEGPVYRAPDLLALQQAVARVAAAGGRA